MVSFCGRKPPEEPYSPPEVVPGDINSYIENRLNDQITWYDKKAQQAQRTYKRMQLTELIVATAIPLLANLYSQLPCHRFCCRSAWRYHYRY